MQIKLWPEVEKGLREIASLPEHKRLKVSIAKLANYGIAQYITHLKEKFKNEFQSKNRIS